jgi:REP element-mobilizing transposase RayT
LRHFPYEGNPLDVPETILTSTGKIVEKYIHSINNVDKLSVEKYVIMPDHIHLILYIDDIDLFGTSRTPSPTNFRIPKTISGFKRLCNKEIGKNIWQRSFHDHIIRDEKDYITRWDYIDNDPTLWVLGKDE